MAAIDPGETEAEGVEDGLIEDDDVVRDGEVGDDVGRAGVGFPKPVQEGILPGAAGQGVGAEAAGDDVATGAAVDDVVAFLAAQDVVAGAAIDDVIGDGAEVLDRRCCRISDNRRVVDVQHIDGDLFGRRGAQAVGNRDLEAVGADEVRIRGVFPGAVGRVDGNGAARPLGRDAVGEDLILVVDVRAGDLPVQDRVLGHGEQVVVHEHGRAAGVGARATVAGDVAELVRRAVQHVVQVPGAGQGRIRAVGQVVHVGQDVRLRAGHVIGANVENLAEERLIGSLPAADRHRTGVDAVDRGGGRGDAYTVDDQFKVARAVMGEGDVVPQTVINAEGIFQHRRARVRGKCLNPAIAGDANLRVIPGRVTHADDRLRIGRTIRAEPGFVGERAVASGQRRGGLRDNVGAGRQRRRADDRPRFLDCDGGAVRRHVGDGEGRVVGRH